MRGANLTPIIKNLLVINVLFFLATYVFESMGINLTQHLAVFYFDSPFFKPWQIVTHMFMHGGITHLFFNMFALYIFGPHLERIWGPKRFLIYYMLTGLGAYVLHTFVIGLEVNNLGGSFMYDFLVQGDYVHFQGTEDIPWREIWRKMSTPTLGASGAVFGILLAFGMYFPNTELMLLFPPIPIKAKYLVVGYGALELMQGMQNNPMDNVAHFAHLGGMIFGFIIIKYWRKNSNTFY